MTDIEIHGVMKCIETMPIKKLQQLETYTETSLRNIRKELEHRKTDKHTVNLASDGVISIEERRK